MPLRFRLWCPQPSRSAALLNRALPTSRRIRRNNSMWSPRGSHILLNWGGSSSDSIFSQHMEHTVHSIINHPENVRIAANKIHFLNEARACGVSIPDFCSNTERYLTFLQGLLERGVRKVVFRDTVTGHGGSGITIYETREAINAINTYPELSRTGLRGEVAAEGSSSDNCPTALSFVHEGNAPNSDSTQHIYTSNVSGNSGTVRLPKLITEYIPRRDEFRVHVAFGGAIHSQKKCLRRDDYRPEQPQFLVRSHDEGFIFTSTGFTPPNSVITEAVKAVEACGLDYGAVDVGWLEGEQKAVVFEVNTRPGLTQDGVVIEKLATTLDSYRRELGS